MKQGKCEGIYILQHDGRTVQERNYKEGKLHGQSRYYNESGSVMCIETFEDDELKEILPQENSSGKIEIREN